MYEVLILLGTLLLTQFVKKYVYPKFGSTGVHILTFVIATIGVGIYQYAQTNIEFKELLLAGLNYLVVAVAVYEVILKKIGFKSAQEKIDDSEFLS